MAIEEINDPDAKLALFKSRQPKQKASSWYILRLILAIVLPAAMAIWILLGLVP